LEYLTKDELEKYIAAHPDKKDELQGLFTIVRRDGVFTAMAPTPSREEVVAAE